MKKRRSDSPDPGHKFGRPDIERIGLFIEMPYISGKRFPPKKTQREPINMLSEGPKSKNGTQHGYFEKVFKRIFSKEALKGRGRKLPPPRFKNVSERPFMPPTGFKYHSCPGDYYGTFSGNIEAFGTKRKPVPKYQREKRNLLTSPAKLGGPGYTDIGLSRYPEHKPDRYGVKPKYKQYGQNLGRALVTTHYPQPYFDNNPFADPPNIKPGPTYVKPKEKLYNIIPPGHIVPTGKGKSQGGCHAGCFEKWPEHKSEKIVRKKPKGKPEKEGLFYPPPRQLKSFYNTSIVHQKVDICLNQTNFDTYQPDYIKYIAID